MKELKGSRTYDDLMMAFAGETQARTKYSIFASKAKEEGYHQIGRIFEETADNEKEHAEIWFRHLAGLGNTAENLVSAAEGEHYEWSSMYADMAKTAREEGFTEIAKQMEQIRGNGSGAADSLFAKIAPPAETEYVICCARDGIYLTGGNEMQLLVAEQLAEHFLTPYACEFARNENGYYHFPLQAGAIALHELKTVFPECKEWIISEESLNATICQCYPTYRTDYNAIVSEQGQIPDVKAPINLFLQEQLDQEKSQMQNTEQEEKLQEFEENMTQEESQGYEEDDEYGEQIEFGY